MGACKRGKASGRSAQPRDHLRILTERLRIRLVTLTDAEETARLMTPSVASNLISWRAPMSVAEAQLRIRQSRQAARRLASIDLAVLLRESNALIGWIGFFTAGADPEFRLGFWLGEVFQAQGYMTEALVATLPASMKYLEINSIVAETYGDNTASARLLHRIGMQPCPAGFGSLNNRFGVETLRFRTVLAS